MKNLSEISHDLDMVTKKYVDEVAATKVDKEEGKQLSTNDFTTEEKEKLAQLNIVQVSELPSATDENIGKIVQYTGESNENYINGYFYKNENSKWVATTSQPPLIIYYQEWRPLTEEESLYYWEKIKDVFNSGGLLYLDYEGILLPCLSLHIYGDEDLYAYFQSFQIYEPARPSSLEIKEDSNSMSIACQKYLMKFQDGLLTVSKIYEDDAWIALEGQLATINNQSIYNGGYNIEIQSSNIHYGSDEPTDKNTVMWIDPNEEPLSVLTTDNTEEYTPVGDYNPATKKYVDDKIATTADNTPAGTITLFSSKKDREGYLLCNNAIVRTNSYPKLSSEVATDTIVNTQLNYYANTFFPKFLNRKLFFSTAENSLSVLNANMEQENLSTDQTTWHDIEYGNGIYCRTTVKSSSSKKYIEYSSDLKNWTRATVDTAPNGAFNGLATNGNGIWMTKSYYQRGEEYYVSTDNGVTWSRCSGSTAGYGTQIAYVHDRFITMNESSQFYYNMGTTDAFVAFTDAGNLSMDIYKVGNEYYCLSGNGIYQINTDFSTTLISTIPTEDSTNLKANISSKGIVAYQGTTLYRSINKTDYTTDEVALSAVPLNIAMSDDTFFIPNGTTLYQGFLEGKASRLPFKIDEENQIYGYIKY